MYSLTLIVVDIKYSQISQAFFIANMIISRSYLPQAQKKLSKWLELSGLLVALVTTLITTLLIVHRVQAVSRQNIGDREPRYTHILRLLIESSALHLIGMLMLAISAILSMTNKNTLLVENMNGYAGAFFPFAAVRATNSHDHIMLDLLSLQSGNGTHTLGSASPTGLR